MHVFCGLVQELDNRCSEKYAWCLLCEYPRENQRGVSHKSEPLNVVSFYYALVEWGDGERPPRSLLQSSWGYVVS